MFYFFDSIFTLLLQITNVYNCHFMISIKIGYRSIMALYKDKKNCIFYTIDFKSELILLIWIKSWNDPYIPIV